MKTINIQSRLTFIGFLANLAIFGAISYFLWKFLGGVNNFDKLLLVIIPVIPIVCAFISFISDSLYISEITFTDDEIRLRYKKGQNTIEVKRILKEDIESFKLYLDASIIYTARYCAPKFFIKVKCDLKNKESIVVDNNLFFDVYGKNPRVLFAQELMINKEEIPNFEYELTGNNLDVIENLKHCYTNGKPISYFKRVQNRLKQFPIFYKICGLLVILLIIVCLFFIFSGKISYIL